MKALRQEVGRLEADLRRAREFAAGAQRRYLATAKQRDADRAAMASKLQSMSRLFAEFSASPALAPVASSGMMASPLLSGSGAAAAASGGGGGGGGGGPPPCAPSLLSASASAATAATAAMAPWDEEGEGIFATSAPSALAVSGEGPGRQLRSLSSFWREEVGGGGDGSLAASFPPISSMGGGGGRAVEAGQQQQKQEQQEQQPQQPQSSSLS
jgi:hypothetical protein